MEAAERPFADPPEVLEPPSGPRRDDGHETVLLQLMAGIGVLAFGAALIDNAFDGPDGLILPMLLLPLVTLLVHAFVRRLAWPVLLVGLTVGPSLVFFLGYAEGSMFFLALASILMIHSLRDLRLAFGLCVLMAGVPVLAGLTSHRDAGWQFWFLGVVLGAFFGYITRRNNELVAELEEQRNQVARQAVAEERQRMARDIHDLVGHSLTVVLLHVTGARRALRRNPSSAEVALEEAERVGRDSLAEIRRSVSLLRADDSLGTQPSPSAGDIRQLVTDGQAAGQRIELRVSGDLDALGGTVGLTAYRLTQESLSNAAKHAVGAPIDVDIVVTDTELHIGIENERRDGRGTDRSGYGLIGMRERVQAVGGNLVVGPAGDCWRVDATLPRELTGVVS